MKVANPKYVLCHNPSGSDFFSLSFCELYVLIVCLCLCLHPQAKLIILACVTCVLHHVVIIRQFATEHLIQPSSFASAVQRTDEGYITNMKVQRSPALWLLC